MLSAMYEQHIEDEEQQHMQQLAAQAHQNANSQLAGQGLPIGQSTPVMNLQLPANRQRSQGSGLLNNQQGGARLGPGGQAGTSMNLQPNAALQAQMNVAQQQALAAQVQAQSQLAQQREAAAVSSPASMQGTPHLHNDSGLPSTHVGTPGRVGSLQGGRIVRGSPNVTNASAVSIIHDLNYTKH
jgi:hypothetical protein